MRIITLIENIKDDSNNLINEKGLCLYIEKDNKHILFDTGRTGNFIYNAKKLGINLENIDAVVLSHGHGDHGGGLIPFFKINSKAKVYMKIEASREFYFHYKLFNKNVSVSSKLFEEYSYRIQYMKNFTEVMKDIYIITDIHKHYEIPEGNKYLFVKKETKLIRDEFHHELIMVIKERDGICIFTGCSHNGTANMIKTAKDNFKDSNIKAVIGGFHLVKIPIIKSLTASRSQIDTLVNEIIASNVEKVYTGHCTGEKAYKKLKEVLGDKIQYIKTGTEIII
ncbi:MBL fold metallo-hydrolase [Clostridium sp. P21]|uniref:MBL fold metallo-hydrolase n=1 Tax=Clostridium muellerianum TaxID=2716538 RepID=A0A7Y0HLL4_9CLOT|nr:MBL fold metallo-hydrolase [Clostridium muellerianum]NMM61335.1 MBL fold metallo-hydrolase [Clostridium muellerianum]